MNTWSGYATALNQFFGWMETAQPYQQMIVNRELQPNFKIWALLAFCKQKWKILKTGEVVALGYSGLNHFHSALMCYLEEKKMLHLVTEEDKQELNSFFSGIKKWVQWEKQEGECNMKEGKEPLPTNLYIALAEEFWRMEISLHSATWHFLGIFVVAWTILKGSSSLISNGMRMHCKLCLASQKITRKERDLKAT